MKKPSNNIVIILLLLHFGLCGQNGDKIISRQGQVSFFSYTSVENIEATNNQVQSIINKENGDIAVQMLLRTFVFKKALMEEHFNESYVESDLYPKLIFNGKIMDYTSLENTTSPKFIKGIMNFHGVKKEIEIKTAIETKQETVVLSGNFEVAIDDFNIKVPALLKPNISKEIIVEFRLEYLSYEE